MVINPYLAIIAFTLTLYFPALKCLVIVDDVRRYGHIKDGKNWAWIEYPKWNNIFQWLAERLYGGGTFGIRWNQKITRWSITSVQIDHAFSVALTAIIGVLIYADFHSIWAALLWISASSTTHVAVWLNGRRYAFNVILALLFVACVNAGGWWRIFTIPLYFATPMFHMTAFFLPVLYPWAIPIMILSIFLIRHRLIEQLIKKENSIVPCSRKIYDFRRIIPIVKSYGFYFRKMLFPMMTRTNYDCLYQWGVTPEGDKDAYALNWDFTSGIIAIIISIMGCCFLPMREKWFWLFTVLSTAQWCNVINISQIVADRYIVLPNVFMQVIIASLLPWWACGAIVVANICFTSMSFRMYENIDGMFDYHFYHWSQHTTPNKEYVALCIKHGDYIKAYTLVKQCLKFNPTDWDLLLAAAVCARCANDRKQARAYVELMDQHLYYGMEAQQLKWTDNFRRSL